jgi:hypothetical protein
MKCYFRERKLIPKGNLIDVQYEKLEKDPLNEIEKIYSNLDLSGFSNAKPSFQKYLQSVKNFKKNIYELTGEIIKIVEEHWDFTIKKWNYSVPELL